MYSIVASANSASSLRGWMQSTGHTSTQAVSLVSIHGSVMIKGMLASLRWDCMGYFGAGSARRGILAEIVGLYLAAFTTQKPSFESKKHHRAGRDRVAKRCV